MDTLKPPMRGSRVSGPPRLGEYLVQRGVITTEQLASALLHQRRTGERLGRLLLTLDYTGRRELARALAGLWGFPFITIDASEVEIAVAKRFPLEATLRFRALALRDDGEVVTIAVAEAPDMALIAMLGRIYPERLQEFRVTTEWDIDRGIALVHRHQVMESSLNGLYFRSPEESGYTLLTRPQWLVFALIAAIVGGAFWIQPMTTLFFLNLPLTGFFAAMALFQIWFGLHGALRKRLDDQMTALADEPDDRELPIYSVLVPIHKGGDDIVDLLRCLRQLDYPVNKLDIILLFDETDTTTLALAKAAAPGAHIRFLIVPEGGPKTRTKSCNVGLLFARGEFLVSFNVADRPEPDQLRRAVTAFRDQSDSLGCLQANVMYHNWNENFLTRLYTLESSVWYDYLLPGLNHLGLPVPLGGSSSHFRTESLRLWGGWDPFNVTGDADLGIRAAMHDCRVGRLDSRTYRQASPLLGTWLRRRSRWMQGYLQTAFVLWRNPAALIEHVGWRQTIGFTLLVAGTPLIFLIQPVLLLLLVLWIVIPSGNTDPDFLRLVLNLSLLNLLIGSALAMHVNFLAVIRRKLPAVMLVSLINPLYWLAHSTASLKALAYLLPKSRFWARTPRAPLAGEAPLFP